MRTALLSLALVVAAAASAQTFTLVPAALSGYWRNGTTTNSRPSPATVPVVLRSALETKRTFVYTTTGTGSSLVYHNTVDQRGWFAEFKLPLAPAGAVLMSAKLGATVATGAGSNSASQPVYMIGYVGNGSAETADATAVSVPSVSATAVPGPFSVDVTSGVRALIGQGATYAGLRLDRPNYQSSPSAYDLMVWSSPTLTVAYGYALRAPLSLGTFVGDPTAVPVAVEVRDPATGAVLASATAYPDASGSVALPAVVPGTYDVSFKASHWLRRTLLGVTIVDASSTLPPVSLINGDANGDNSVNVLDRGLVTGSIGTALGDAGYSANADLNGDGYVNVLDRGIATSNIGEQGDE